MVGAEVNIDRLIGSLTDAERRRLPSATLIALNDAAFSVRRGWADAIGTVFDRPTRLTLGAPLVKKATIADLQAEVFIRNEATKGTPPSAYLLPQVQGGAREQKPSEKLLATHPRGRKYFTPGKGASSLLDASGNLPRSAVSKILSQLFVRRDIAQNESSTSRARRMKRQRKKGGGGSYFILAQKRGKLRAGVVYERIETAHGSAVRSVLFGMDKAPQYRKRYNVFALAQEMFGSAFRTTFARAMRGLSR